MSPGADDFSRFENFTIINTTYKVVSGHAIGADFLIPKRLLAAEDGSSKPRPVMLRFHGGGLVAGSSTSPKFFARWLLQLAERHAAVIVSPNYRLFPESSVADILTDIRDFWSWLHSEAPARVLDEQTDRRVQLDTGRILTTGDSAGGYLALMTALDHPDAIRAVATAYPMCETRNRLYTEIDETAVRMGVPYKPRSVYDEHLAKVARGELPAIVSEDKRCERDPLMFAAVHNAIYGLEMFEEGGRQQPMERVEAGERFPSGGVLIIQGRDDTLVPPWLAETLKATALKLDPTLDLRLCLQPGEHCFDGDVSMDDPWMKEG